MNACRFGTWCLMLAIGVLPTSLWAAGKDSKRTEEKKAEDLFKRARALVKADRWAEACPLFEQSHAADPALGTLLNWAECLEHQGQRARAYVYFNEVLAWSLRNREATRADIARERLAQLKSQLSWVALTNAGTKTVAVKVNGVPVELGTTSQSVPVDPGEVVISASAPDYESWEQRASVSDGASLNITVPQLKRIEELKPLARNSGTPTEESGLKMPPISERELQNPPLVEVTSTAATKSRTGPMVTMTAGGVLAAAAIAGLVWSYDTYDHLQKQKPGGPEAGNPQVSLAEFNALMWIQPTSWIVGGLGLTALAAGFVWFLME